LRRAPHAPKSALCSAIGTTLFADERAGTDSVPAGGAADARSTRDRALLPLPPRTARGADRAQARTEVGATPVLGRARLSPACGGRDRRADPAADPEHLRDLRHGPWRAWTLRLRHRGRAGRGRP